MKKGIKYPYGRIETKVAREGESIEQMLKKAVNGGEPIKANAKVTYNDRKDGVLQQHDIRTDRFEVAITATDKIHASEAAKRQAMDFPKDKEEKNIYGEKKPPVDINKTQGLA